MTNGPAKPPPHAPARTQPYWRAAAEGRLLLQRCGSCGRWQHYARVLCTACWSPDVAWQEASGRGTLWTYTVAHRAPHPAWAEETPYVIAVATLDEGPRLLGTLRRCAPEDVRVGMPLRAVFERRDGYGVVHFAPAEGEAA